MLQNSGLSLAIVFLFLALSGRAAPQPADGDIGLFFFVEAKEGMGEQFEEGYKRHLDWHERNGDPWSWLAWQVIVGEHPGAYIEGTFGRRWEDFDHRIKPGEDAADSAINVSPYRAKYSSRIYKRLQDYSNTDYLERGASVALMEFRTFDIAPGRANAYYDILTALANASAQGHWLAEYVWYEMVSGDSGPRFMLIAPRVEWAAYQDFDASILGALERSLPSAEFQRLQTVYRASVLAERSRVTRFRPDLSRVAK